MTDKDILTHRLDFIQRLMDERQVSAEVALKLQTAEIHRRLELLNGEADRLRQMANTYLRIDIFDAKFTDLQKAVAELRTLTVAREARGQVLAALIAGFVSIVVAFGSRLFIGR